jgi:hypothetical protein
MEGSRAGMGKKYYSNISIQLSSVHLGASSRTSTIIYSTLLRWHNFDKFDDLNLLWG